LIIQATLLDNKELMQYKIQIQPSTSAYVSEDTSALSYWNFTRVFDVSGTTALVLPELAIPDTIASGWYYILLNTVDASGKLSATDTQTVFIRSQADDLSPTVQLQWPADLQVFTSSDTLTVTATVSDNTALSSTVFNVFEDNLNQLQYTSTQNTAGSTADVVFRFPLSGLSAGTYHFQLRQYDRALNTLVQSRVFGIQ
jgi:hypothetical protein